jgi:hypothetical protein
MIANILTEKNYPEIIERCRIDLHDLQSKEIAVQESLDGFIAAAEANVAAALNEAGKPVFSNETARKAEVKRLVAESEFCAAQQVAIAEAKKERVFLEARIERLRAEHRQALAMLEYETASLK